MSAFLNRLNLRPQELRLVVIVFAIVFVVLNVWLVVPHFDDWGKAKKRLAKAKATLVLYQREIDPKRLGEYRKKLRELEGAGSTVATDERSFDLARIIQNQASASGVTITRENPGTVTSGKTNEFFEERARVIDVSTGEKELVDFLVALGSTNSMIRVKSMNLKPDQTQMRLMGGITLVASYQKKTLPPKSNTTAAKPAPASTPSRKL